MAFEPKRSIAGIMLAHTGQWPNAGQGVLSGLMAGQNEARRNQEMDMRRRTFELQENQITQAAAKNEAMRPFFSKVLGVDEKSLPPGWDMTDTKAMHTMVTTANEEQRKQMMEQGNAAAAAAVNYMNTDPNGQQYPAFKAQMDKLYPGNKLPETYNKQEIVNGLVKFDYMQKYITTSMGGNTDSKIRVHQYYEGLEPSRQQTFMETLRGPQTENLGDRVVVLSPGGGIQNEYEKRPAPEQDPAFKAEQAGYVEHEKGRQKWIISGSKLQNNIGAVKARTDLMLKNIDLAKQLANGYTTQYGAVLNKWPGSQQRELRNLLDMIRANIGFAELSDMRAQSPTGGALGQVSEFENKMLQSVMGALDQASTVEELNRVLDDVIAQRQGSLSRLERAYQMDADLYSRPYSPPVQQEQSAVQQPLQQQQEPETTNYGPRTGGQPAQQQTYPSGIEVIRIRPE